MLARHLENGGFGPLSAWRSSTWERLLLETESHHLACDMKVRGAHQSSEALVSLAGHAHQNHAFMKGVEMLAAY